MTDQAALQTIDRAKAEQWEKLDLAEMELCNTSTHFTQTNLRSTILALS